MMQPWFSQAKFGIFLHWGIYAVNGIPESWSFFNGEISYEDYLRQCESFTAAAYDPDAWARLFARAGARYAVLTAKHHDGIALFNTELSELHVATRTPAGRDLVGPFCEAMRQHGLRTGLYFSHLDWSHPDYASVRNPNWPAERVANPFTYRGTPDLAAWERFLSFHRGQLRELCERYQPDLLWFDGDWERSRDQWRMAELREQLHAWAPNVILNSRMMGHGDYQTPEQGVPITRPDGPWEFCVTMNDSWGFQHNDRNYKSVRQLIRMLCECIGMGGNMLLGIGPKADGSLPEEAVQRLEEIGAWLHPRHEAVYPTQAGLPFGHFSGPTALTTTRETLYLFQFDRPWDQIAVKGIRNNIRRIQVLGSDRELTFRKIGGADWLKIPGVLWIDLPEDALNPYATVVKVELDGPLDLYHGAGGAIESN